MTARGVLLIGASSPIGQAIANSFAQTGDRVFGASLQETDDDAFTEHIVADCTHPPTADTVVRRAHATFERLDVVVLAAAVMPVASAVNTTDDQWTAGIDATLSSAFYVARAALRLLTRGASIVAISSVNSSRPAPGLPAYAAAKAGVEGLVRQLALEYGPAGIRVNAVAPGMIGNANLENVTQGYPLGRVGTPEDVAEAVTFLASDRAGFITGTTLPVDGGFSIAPASAWLRPDLRSRWMRGDPDT